jgi:hypothetical protein
MIRTFHFEQWDRQSSQQESVHMNAAASGSHAPLPTVIQLTKIFTAFMCSLLMALFFFILTQGSAVNAVAAMHPLFALAGQIVLVGSALASGAIVFAGTPLAIVAWRTTPRIRLLLTLPLLAFLLPLLSFMLVVSGATLAGLVVLYLNIILAIVVWRLTPTPRIQLRFFVPFLAIALLMLAFILAVLLPRLAPLFPIGFIGSIVGNVLSYPIPIIGNLGSVLLEAFIFGTPLVSTLAINRAIKQVTIPDKWLSFARIPLRIVVFALIAMLLGLLFWGFYAAIFAPALFFSFFGLLPLFNSWPLICVGMLASVIVAVRALSSRIK